MSKLCIGPLLKSSTHIQVLYENRDEEHSSIDICVYINDNIVNIYESYKNSITMPLDFDAVIHCVNRFEKMNLHENFVKATYEEYFNKTLNYLLVIDFIISFNKNDKTDSRNIDHSSIFKFFVDLSYFFKFMNYLDVTHTFLDYIKTMLVLYLQSLDRSTINMFFSHVIWILDDFFKFEVVKHLLCDKLEPQYKDAKLFLSVFEPKYFKELNSEYQNIDYTTAEYRHLTTKFYLDYEKNIMVARGAYYGDEDNDDNDSDDGHFAETVNSIEQTDINYELYRTQFIFKLKQERTKIITDAEAQINDLLKDIKIKDLSSLKQKLDVPNTRHYNLLTYIGEIIDYTKLSEYTYSSIFNIAYNMVYFDIIKTIVETTNVKPQIYLCNDFNYKEINQYLKKKFPTLKETMFTTFESKE